MCLLCLLLSLYPSGWYTRDDFMLGPICSSQSVGPRVWRSHILTSSYSAQDSPAGGLLRPLLYPVQSVFLTQVFLDIMVSRKRLIFLRSVSIPSLIGVLDYLGYIPYIAFMCGPNSFICFTPNTLRKLLVTEAYATTQGKLCLLTQSGCPNPMSQPHIRLQKTQNQTREA